MTKSVTSLTDRYVQTDGEVFLSGMHALTRLPLDQARRDRAAGLTTAGFVTGYRGSPITTLDAQLWSAKAILEAHDVHFEPGLNEELAATSLRGTQQLDWFGKPRVQGVFAMWYGKGLGVDRACEALKLGNLEGSHAHGGVLIVAGDDPAAKSSASAHQSEHTLIAGFIPVLAPSTTEEILEYGLYGWALSRFSGLYVGLKAVTDTLDLSASTPLPKLRTSWIRPNLERGDDLNLKIGQSALRQESLVVNARLPAALAFHGANPLDRVAIDGPRRVLTVVTVGKSYLDVRQALLDLGLDEARCRDLGLRVVKIALVWPLDAAFARATCAGSRECLVVEEKRPVIEDQLARALYADPARPAITGKVDPEGRPLLGADGVLDVGTIRRALVYRLDRLGLVDEALRERAARLGRDEAAAVSAPALLSRPAYFCSGCPHNTSTVVPEGSFALGATGCHGLAVGMPERKTLTFVGMGAEGMPWIGAQRFVDTNHVFLNMGDGTYTHSGLLAIRAAVAAGGNMTYKVLFNDAVAMTGGQPMEGTVTAEGIVRQLVGEGVQPVILVSDDPARFAPADLPAGTRILHRDHLDGVQRELRETPGVTAIVYDQTCANEKRRRRKRGLMADPDMRLFIQPDVCEGCGDCSRQSNCMSLQPLETEFGRKRAIDQSNCNKDYSCIKGFCPSFVTLRGARPAKRAQQASAADAVLATLPAPPIVDLSTGGYAMLVTGIGGTGVLTIGAILGTAAQIEGKVAKVLDMTGMAQKGGSVMSHLRFGADLEQIPGARVGVASADVMIACDLVVSAGPEVLAMLGARSTVLANADVAPTGDFQTNRTLDLSATRLLQRIERRVGKARVKAIHATELMVSLLGDSIFANLFMVGLAAQRGLLPVGLEAIEAAVRLNGTAVEANLRALGLGRVAAVAPAALHDDARPDMGRARVPQTFAALVSSRRRHLVDYQGERLARRYDAFLARLTTAVGQREASDPEPFLMAAADQMARLLAYKDEYEIARLYSRPSFKAELAAQFDGDIRLAFNLAPPLLAIGKDARTGRQAKVEIGAWILPVFAGLARLRGLRGTPFDPFGWTEERRTERALASEYDDLIMGLVNTLSDDTLALATEAAAAASLIAGYGPVKLQGLAAFRETIGRIQARLAMEVDPEAPVSPPAPVGLPVDQAV